MTELHSSSESETDEIVAITDGIKEILRKLETVDWNTTLNDSHKQTMLNWIDDFWNNIYFETVIIPGKSSGKFVPFTLSKVVENDQ